MRPECVYCLDAIRSDGPSVLCNMYVCDLHLPVSACIYLPYFQYLSQAMED